MVESAKRTLSQNLPLPTKFVQPDNSALIAQLVDQKFEIKWSRAKQNK
jgi:hypothetical protein